MMRLWIVSLILLVACMPTASATPKGSPTPGPDALSGTLVLADFDGWEETGATGCTGTGGYSDISEGAAVTVKDQDGRIIATSSLGKSHATSTTCEFQFVITPLPRADFYSIEVSHRGEVTYSKADLQAQDWTVALTLGK